jgi:hypothetical protein
MLTQYATLAYEDHYKVYDLEDWQDYERYMRDFEDLFDVTIVNNEDIPDEDKAFTPQSGDLILYKDDGPVLLYRPK